ncbi:MAG: glutamate-ammonia-ligase adenylyltransferase [Alkalispirochaeta sp.]
MTRRIRRALDAPDFTGARSLLEGLPEQYGGFYSDSEIQDHARAVQRLSTETPVAVADFGHEAVLPRPDTSAPDVEATGDYDNVVHFTICTYDAPGLFSYLTGILGSFRFNIQSGHVFTSSKGIAIDTFRGFLPSDAVTNSWAESLELTLTQVLAPLQSRPPDAATVRDTVMERVARTITVTDSAPDPLLPVAIEVEQEDPLTRVTVTSQDTLFFLYSLASAFVLQDVSIVSVEIATSGDEVRDRFWIQKIGGGAITREADIERLRLSVLVTKQFSHALDQAADPLGAFTRFEELVRRVALEGGGDQLRSLLADPNAQRELARLLGASDFLWEDFIRLQYENLLPLLGERHNRTPLSTPSDELGRRLDAELTQVETWEEQTAILNRFKDHESYLIDADHILQRDTDFFFLSHRLTRLADVVVDRAFRLAWDDLVQEYGTPQSAAGLPADYAVFGLGKMGGSALGYASDIELMVIYSDHGETTGSHRRDPMSNREFFERLVRRATDAIQSRREAIFEVDLRLRPYGQDGPRAVHIESFIEYFGPTGKAHSAERLALIRLRHVAGNQELGRRITTIRDQLVYESDSIQVAEIRSLRERQAEQKAAGGAVNAKFSPGALVDLEYNVQLLQVEEGRTTPELRNPGIHASLRALSETGTIDEAEAEAMIRAYRFLRNLINGLRMLRGNAQDLYLPPFDSSEAAHLARRMGYRDDTDFSAAEQLRVDFDVETAGVRSFVERHLGQDALPPTTTGNPADLVLSDSISEERISAVLTSAGFRNPARGIVNLRRMAGTGTRRETFARLAVLAWDYLRRSGDPDMALNNWDRFTEQVGDREEFFAELLAQPRRLEIMVKIFAGSQFLSDTLIRTPGFLGWISDPAVVNADRDEGEMIAELMETLTETDDRMERINILRRFRRREILRIGTRDICLAGEFEVVVAEISALARATVQAALQNVQLDHPEPMGRFSIMAFGKLGGGELNYSSDIDLLAIYEPDEQISDQEHRLGRLFRQVVRDLTDFTVEGQAYRVDLRLRPWGNAGRLVYSIPTLERYYTEEADLWELQALLKLSPVAGDKELGRSFTRSVGTILAGRGERAGRDAILHTVRRLRVRAVQEHDAAPDEEGSLVGADIKNGEGGIRDVEFLVQALQMLHQRLSPEIVTGNTLSALQRLEEAGILSQQKVSALREDYLFLRRIEHFLQVYDDRQLHAIPAEQEAQEKLTRVVLGENARPEELLQRLEATLNRVRADYIRVITPEAR